MSKTSENLDKKIEAQLERLKQLKAQKQAIEARERAKQKEQEKIEAENRRKVLEKIKSEIQGKFISIHIKVGADGKNFGNITTKLVCEEFEAQTGIHLDKRKVELPAEINSVGIFTANVKLDKDLIATFEINVIAK